jgi:flagellar basal-body rod modification protein FlgD
MDLTALNNTVNPGQATAASSANKSLGKDDFLRLFVTQLRAQNPLNPMDATGFTAQLAQFSSLEQLTNLSSQMGQLVQFQGSLQNTLTAGLIGKRVEAIDGTSGTVRSVLFGQNGTSLLLDTGATITLDQIKQIQGGI